jgi:probable HAF family extracellular repeat protein
MHARSFAAVAFALLLCAAVSGVAQPRYRVTDLGTPGPEYVSSQALAINNQGQVAGYGAQGTFGPFIAFRYSHGVMRPLRIAATRGELRFGRAINDRGWVAGDAMLARCECLRAFVYDGTRATILGHLAGSGVYGTSQAFGINRAGHVTGITQVAIPGLPYLQEHAFVWNGQRMRDLGTLGGKFSIGYGINRWGWVAGRSQLADEESQHAFVYKAGALHDLGVLGGEFSMAVAINDKGWVSGASTTYYGSPVQAFVHKGRAMRGLGPKTYWGYGINTHGWVVGVGSAPGGGGAINAFLYDGSTVHNLNDLIEGQAAAKGWLREAYGINDRGQIVGVWFPDRTEPIEHAFLLTPIAEGQ